MNYYVIFFEKGVPSSNKSVHHLTHKTKKFYTVTHFPALWCCGSRDTVYLVRTYTGITFEYFFSTPSKLFSNEKSPKYSPAFAELLYPTPEHTECVTRGGSASRTKSTTVFLFLSFAYFFLFLSRKKRKEMGIY